MTYIFLNKIARLFNFSKTSKTFLYILKEDKGKSGPNVVSVPLFLCLHNRTHNVHPQSKRINDAEEHACTRLYHASLYARDGCYEFKEEGFYCVATVELLEKRLKIKRRPFT